MDVIRHPDPGEFLDRIGPWLERAEARNNLILGVAATLVDRPGFYEEYALWSIEDGASVLAAASLTPPFRLVVADSSHRDAVEALVRAVHHDRQAIPGVLANRPTADWFVASWQDTAQVDATLMIAQGVYCLEGVEEVPRPEGRPRSATLRDIDSMSTLVIDFQVEALPDEPIDANRTREMLQIRLDEHPGSGMWVWDLGGEIASLSGYGGRTPTGIRIGPVYTPPEHRSQGYATALVAEQSRWLLETGRQFCFLYTDLANPSSNAIYERIGFRRVAEAAQWRFSG